ncbi:hypothetical protein JB92DRAFT_1115465 [Gautieria morchelliformis]|nr:hypothetical protein JB92DRAFT_1115465 [Gautieria morchelliformis]
MPLVPARFTPPLDTETDDWEILPKKSRSKRKFNDDFLPVLILAFEKDPFPSRKDKEHLAHISRMSLRQITAWFQNRRCRTLHRAKSQRVTPSPKPFEEMKERLSDSARALSKANPLVKKNPDPTEYHGDTPPESSTHVVSPGVTEDAPSPGSCSDERVELTDYGLLGTAVYQLPTSVEEHTPVPHIDNPLNPPTTLVHAYPAVYEPSQLTSDSFVVGQGDEFGFS